MSGRNTPCWPTESSRERFVLLGWWRVMKTRFIQRTHGYVRGSIISGIALGRWEQAPHRHEEFVPFNQACEEDSCGPCVKNKLSFRRPGRERIHFHVCNSCWLITSQDTNIYTSYTPYLTLHWNLLNRVASLDLITSLFIRSFRCLFPFKKHPDLLLNHISAVPGAFFNSGVIK